MSENLNFYTTTENRNKINYPLKQKIVFDVIIMIVPILGLLFTWMGYRL